MKGRRKNLRSWHEVTVFAPEYEQTEDIRPGEQFEDLQETRRERVIRYKTSSRKMENGMVYPRIVSREIVQAFEKEQFDCIHVHHPMFVGPIALYLGKKYDLPVIYTYHTKYEDYLHYIRPFQSVEDKSAVWQEIFRLGREKVVPGYMRWFNKSMRFDIGADLQYAGSDEEERNEDSNGNFSHRSGRFLLYKG